MKVLVRFLVGLQLVVGIRMFNGIDFPINLKFLSAESEPQKHQSILEKITSNNDGSISDTESTSTASTNTSTHNSVRSKQKDTNTFQKGRPKGTQISPGLQQAEHNFDGTLFYFSQDFFKKIDSWLLFQ